jgi:RNA polymerase sigma-70 factor (ECF subfamily)
VLRDRAAGARGLLRVSDARHTEAVYAALHGAVRGWFARRAPPDAVDDLVQEAFLRIHRGLPTVRDRDRVGPWVWRVCRNLLLDRRRSDRPEEALDDDVVDPAEVEVGDATAVVAAWLPAFVDQLPAPYREAVRLSELEGVSQAEVAARLGLSASGARSRVQRGRRMVREALDDCCRVVIDGGEVVDVTARAGCGCVEVGVEPGQRADGACDGAPCGAASG